MSRRFSATERRRRLSLRYAAMERPELRLGVQEARTAEGRTGTQGIARVAPAGPHSAPIKQMDPDTRALIDAALAHEVHRP